VSVDHLRYSQIVDIATGLVVPDAAAASHLAECTTCARGLAWLTQLIDLMRDARAEPPPPEATARVKALFRQRRVAAPTPHLIYATLRFDSARTAPAFGLRSAATIERQLLLSADGCEIDLRIIPADGRWALCGQILGRQTGTGGSAEILGANELARAEISDLDEFVLTPVPAGRYTLTLILGNCTIVVPGLSLGS
jgi:hypothetical protein